MKIGFHVSTSKGYPAALLSAKGIGATTFQFFPSNPRGNGRRDISDKEIDEFQALRNQYNFKTLVSHAPYIINLASNKNHVIENGQDILRKDFERLNLLGVDKYVLHPGNHVGQGIEKGLKLIVKGLNEVLSDKYDFYLCLETMSGMGTEIGSKFEELSYLIDNIEYSNVGVCLDTCHMYSAGYDIKNNYEEVFETFDKVIGIDKLKVIHINDTLKELGSKKDRHCIIGEGNLGFDTFHKFINDERFTNIPFILETPNDIEGYREEIKILKDLKNE
ncbi:deoxyribonuclease IV [Lagierella sp.]|uniref:deoxyribonuclease IV n=1 Tax=Lagierella sp. TaxID=2849657 RepID=UPI00262FBDB1|nr:deoxyribonuclease IV [Lagierella sp.]